MMGLREPNYEMAILARQARGHSQKQLASLLGVTPGVISKIEHGIAPLTSERVHQLAQKLDYPEGLFYRVERVRGTDSICFYHRKRKTMPARALERIEAEMHLAQLQVTSLLTELAIEAPLEFPSLDPGEYGGPEAVARLVRAMWRVPAGPVSNLVRLVESAGAVVLLRDFDTRKLDGLSSWAKGVPPLFFLNSEMPMDRLRWTIAHELGHLVMHWTAPQNDPEEEADAFAAELLLPAKESRADLRQLTFKRLPQFKAYWLVSMWALVRTADRRGLLPPNQVKSLYVQMSRAGWRTREPYPLTPETPRLANEAIDVHLKEHGYTVDELAHVVNLNPDEFAQMYSLRKAARSLRAV